MPVWSQCQMILYVPNVPYSTDIINFSNPAKGICVCVVTAGSKKLRLERLSGSALLWFCRVPAERVQL